MSGLRDFAARSPIAALLGVGLVSLAAAHAIVDLRTGEVRLRLDSSVDAMLPAGDEARSFYEYARERFGSDEQLVIALHDSRGVYQPGILRAVRRMTHRIETVHGVHHVLSLANALDLRGQDGDVQVEPFLAAEVPEDPEALAAIRRAVETNPIYAGNLVSRDATTTAVVVTLMDLPEREFLERNVGYEIRRIADEERGEAEAWATGSLLIKAETGRVLLDDLRRIVPLALVVLAAVSLVFFRSIRAAVVPLATIALALLWTLGLVAVTGRSLNLVTVVVPPVVLVVGFAYAIHVVSEFQETLARGVGRFEAARDALAGVAFPVVLTGLTTAAGFLSLTTSRLGPIREFGVFCALGVGCAVVASLTFAPAALRVWPRGRRGRAKLDHARAEALFERLALFDLRRRGLILVIGIGIALLAAAASMRIRVSNDFITTFPAESRIRTDFESINAHLEGAGSLMVVLDAPYKNTFKDPDHLREVESLQAWLEEQPEIGGTTSLVDFVKLIHRGFMGNDPAQERIPDSTRLVSQLLFFGGGDEIESFVDSQYKTLAIAVRTHAVSSEEASALIAKMETRLAEVPEHLHPRITGNTVLVARTLDDLAWGQAMSLGSAFLIIYLILALLFTSPRVGLLALIPNALPVLFYFGVLGVSGVTLNPTTGLVACLVLGIAVDDTIHFLTRFNLEAKRRADESQGIVHALRKIGVPVTATSIALCLGFLVMMTAQRRAQVEFGTLAAVTLAFAWLADITFTPALAARMRIVTLWEVLTLDLGETPEQTIPLFRGLSKTQARIVALLTSFRSYEKGHQLFSIGDAGASIVVVVDGTLSASLPGEGGPIELARHQRGDVIGEVALFSGRRTANVQAETEVRLLEISKEGFERVRRRHPRVAALLYRNLSDAQAQRLARLTLQLSER